MSLLERFRTVIKSKNLFSEKDHLLLAVSGGLDSIVLCELVKQSGLPFSIAHCNFKLRGEESERDEQFVKKLGEKYQCEVLTRIFDTENYASENKLSIQEAARELRYNWFNELLDVASRQLPIADWLLTAHHADDNIETLLMNFFRGTGLNGLTGIPQRNKKTVRPLLSFSKEELLQYAKENNLDWVEDSSNESSKYSRNYFRNELIPAIEKVFPQVKHNLQENIQRFAEIGKVYKMGVNDLKRKLCRNKGEEVHIPVLQLQKQNSRALIYEIIQPFGFTEGQIDEVIKLFKAESGKYVLSPDELYRVLKHRHWLIIAPVDSSASENIVIDDVEKDISFALGKLCLKKSNHSTLNIQQSTFNIQHSTFKASLDLKNISFPLILRKWKAGDYFYPLGMRKKKKLSRFLIDKKLSAIEKEKIWVLESNHRIIWVVGQRIDDRFKIIPSTSEVLQIECSPAQ